jgi:hypothetical protein
MRQFVNVLFLLCVLNVAAAADAAEFQDMTNEQFLKQFLASGNPEKAEAETKKWIDGFVDAFASVYRFEMQDGDQEWPAETPSCVYTQDKEDLYLLLITSGAVEKVKDLSVTKTLYLMLRLGCKESVGFGPLPTWVVNGGYDQLGIEIPR